ncbi:SOS response-associated peptidase [Prosthecobacter sp.]|uniref:SOS response-associated peptidase n=1 Tax=Prosthecobacter sp. TaxID=1965333 RepID=UPI003784C2FA
MNTRYTISTGSVAKAARRLLLEQPDMHENRHHAPMRAGPVVRAQGEKPAEIEMMRWGITLRWLPRPLITARAETITEKPSCRGTFESSRCLVIAESFYEWHAGERGDEVTEYRLPYDEPMVFAGIWARLPQGKGGSTEGYAVLTTRANEMVRQGQERMPVILRPADWHRWLAPTSNPKELGYLLQPWTGTLTAHRTRLGRTLEEEAWHPREGGMV